jgi:hypothetical protein
MSHKVPAKAYAVIYTWHGAQARAIFLTRDRALDYIAKYNLLDAKLRPMYYEDDFEGIEGCIAKPSDVVLELVESAGTTGSVTACPVVISELS